MHDKIYTLCNFNSNSGMEIIWKTEYVLLQGIDR